MTTYIRTGSLGLIISFLGSLPIGTLNLTAFYIASRQSVEDALWFAIAVVLVELFVVRFTLWGDRKIKPNQDIVKYLLPLGAMLLLYLSISTFGHSSVALEPEQGRNFFPAIRSSFVLGLVLSLLNPLHIPFWMSWNRVLSSRNSLVVGWKSYTSYISGIGLGSMFGLLIFIFAGQYLFQNYHQYDHILNLILGLFYAGFSIYLFVLFLRQLKK